MEFIQRQLYNLYSTGHCDPWAFEENADYIILFICHILMRCDCSIEYFVAIINNLFYYQENDARFSYFTETVEYKKNVNNILLKMCKDILFSIKSTIIHGSFLYQPFVGYDYLDKSRKAINYRDYLSRSFYRFDSLLKEINIAIVVMPNDQYYDFECRLCGGSIVKWLYNDHTSMISTLVPDVMRELLTYLGAKKVKSNMDN